MKDTMIRCAECGESIPREHSIRKPGFGRVCWFCSDDLVDDSGDWDETEYDDYEDESDW